MKLDTQFSIYKIDINKFLSIRGMEKLPRTKRTNEILNNLVRVGFGSLQTLIETVVQLDRWLKLDDDKSE